MLHTTPKNSSRLTFHEEVIATNLSLIMSTFYTTLHLQFTYHQSSQTIGLFKINPLSYMHFNFTFKYFQAFEST